MTPSNARRSLRALWKSVKVESCADGSVRIVPTYREAAKWRKLGALGPGLFTRMHAAQCVEDVLDIWRKK